MSDVIKIFKYLSELENKINGKLYSFILDNYTDMNTCMKFLKSIENTGRSGLLVDICLYIYSKAYNESNDSVMNYIESTFPDIVKDIKYMKESVTIVNDDFIQGVYRIGKTFNSDGILMYDYSTYTFYLKQEGGEYGINYMSTLIPGIAYIDFETLSHEDSGVVGYGEQGDFRNEVVTQIVKYLIDFDGEIVTELNYMN